MSFLTGSISGSPKEAAIAKAFASAAFTAVAVRPFAGVTAEDTEEDGPDTDLREDLGGTLGEGLVSNAEALFFLGFLLVISYEENFTILGASAGMHLLVQVQTDLSDQEIITQAAHKGVSLTSAAPFYLGNSKAGQFLLGYANLAEEKIDQGIQRLAQILAAPVLAAKLDGR